MKMCGMIVCVVMPFCAGAQGVSGGLQGILDQLYNDMLPMCKNLIGVARGMGGFGALWYIGARVFKHIAHAEPVDVYALLRPFALGMCILLFPSVIALINAVMEPTVTVTGAMVDGSNEAIKKYLALKESSLAGVVSLNPSSWIQEGFRYILELVFEAAAFIINVNRTFYLIVLAIIGPIVFGLSIYDGFQHLLTVWLARYINVFLWLPVANIFGAIIAKIQEQMVTAGLPGATLPGQPLSTTDWAYMAFLLIGIVGYFSVPSVASYIVNAGGGNTLLQKVTMLSSSAAKSSASSMASDVFGGSASQMNRSMSDHGISNGYFKDKAGK